MFLAMNTIENWATLVVVLGSAAIMVLQVWRKLIRPLFQRMAAMQVIVERELGSNVTENGDPNSVRSHVQTVASWVESNDAYVRQIIESIDGLRVRVDAVDLELSSQIRQVEESLELLHLRVRGVEEAQEEET